MSRRPAEVPVSRVPRGDLRRARRAFLLVGVGVPAAIGAIGLVLVLVWLPELPDPVAVHWGLNGPDGFAPPIAYAWLVVGVGLGLPVLLALTALAMTGRTWGPTTRLLGAVAAGLGGLGTVLAAGLAAVQRGVPDARDAGGVGGVVALAVVVLFAFSAAGWLAQPGVRPDASAPLRPAQLASIAKGERVVWIATARMPRGGAIAVALSILALVAISAVTFVLADEAVWVPLAVLAMMCVLYAAFSAFRVVAGPAGLCVRSLLGVPRTTVGLDEIESVRAVDCHPFAEFGGWGWRIGLDGRTGIVVRSGAAIEVARRGRRPLVVTVEGAEVGAAVLQAHLDHARRGGRGD